MSGAGLIRLQLVVEQLDEMHEVIKLIGREVQLGLKAVRLAGMGFEHEEGVEAWEVAAFLFKGGEAGAFNQQIDQPQAFHVAKQVDVLATDDKGIAADEGIFLVVNHMYARAAGDDDDFIKGMGVGRGGVLIVHASDGETEIEEVA